MMYRIHPAIGIARVGTSEDYYLAPESAGALPINPDGRPFTARDFRDESGLLRRQAARFEIFRYRTHRMDRAPGQQEGQLVRVHRQLRTGRIPAGSPVAQRSRA
jgi:hypothetical protein